MRKKILITGANSFIGKSFIHHCNSDYEIDEVCLIKNKPNEIHFNDYDAVIHVAAIVHSSKNIPLKEYLNVNSDLAYETALNAKKNKVSQFIFLSTVKVYGERSKPGEEWNEFTTCKPVDRYAISKMNAEKKIINLQDDKFIVSIVRPAVVYGVDVKANIFNLIKFVSTYKFIPFKNIDNKRVFIYIENLVSILDRIIQLKANGVFLATDGKAISTSDLIYEIIENLNKSPLFIEMPFRRLFKIIFPKQYLKIYGNFEINNKHTLDKLNLKLPYSYKIGIKKTVQWYLENQLSK